MQRLFLILGIMLFSGILWGDKVYLKDGRVIEGSISHTTEEYVDITTAGSLLMSIEVSEIDSINTEKPTIEKETEEQSPNSGKEKVQIESKATDNSFSRKTRPNTIYCGVGFPTLLTLGYKRQIFSNLSLGIRAGGFVFVGGAGIGLKHYYPKTSCHSFTVGVHEDVMVGPGGMCISDPPALCSVTSITIGYDYLSYWGFNFFLDAGGFIAYKFYSRDEEFWWFPYVNIGIGYGF